MPVMEQGLAYFRSGESEFSPRFLVMLRVAQTVAICIVFYRSLLVFYSFFSIGHSIVSSHFS